KDMRSILPACILFFFLGLTGCQSASQTSAQEGEQQKNGKKEKPGATDTGGTQEKAGGVKRKPNALARETSPYLLLHAHNPVNWYAWNPESLKKAKEEGKIIFLSIGYSSCHWCHVMERESFMDEEIAKFLNENFVCIKVDREERPDVDSIYMNALYVVSRGRGGWPLTMFLTPDAKPFFGTTYMPARDGDRGNQPGFLRLIQQVAQVWKDDPKTLLSDAETVTKLVRERMEASFTNTNVAISSSWGEQALKDLTEQFDPEYGGFGFNPFNGNRPKFPEPSNLEFLLDVCRRDPANTTARNQLFKTLDRMALGGIRDHLGGGFHRYSVDRFWKIPHFEKMLYDNGQLASVYAEAYELSQREDYRRIAVELLDFVLAELTHPEGAFYSALDAESENEEGKYYRWTRKEIEELIGDEEHYELFKNVYQIDREPNFEEKYYAPQFSRPARELAAERKVSFEVMESRLMPLRQVLFQARKERARPLLDTKILASWNGLMIRGFADAGRIFKEPRYVNAAEKAANFILAEMQREGRLLRTHSAGESKLNAYLDDYAFLIDGLIALYKATREKEWLKKAMKLQEKQIELFWDEKGGGFFFTSSDHESLLARAKNAIDGARPSGISVSANNLIYLGIMGNRKDMKEKCKLTIQAVANLLQRAPSSAPRMLVAVRAYVESK
ncbi:MAG: thioredoxin domain-containing protein, partial [Planctomycetota bacterium]|nr:thioredoxin domain-containing protein [Planctomycetota bacterium]